MLQYGNLGRFEHSPNVSVGEILFTGSEAVESPGVVVETGKCPNGSRVSRTSGHYRP